MLLIQGTKTTPRIELVDGACVITGDSLPEHAFEFYKPVFEYMQNSKSIIIVFQYSYFNTSTAKVLVEMFHTLETLYSRGDEVKVKWESIFNDEDMTGMGIDLLEGYNFPWEAN